MHGFHFNHIISVVVCQTTSKTGCLPRALSASPLELEARKRSSVLSSSLFKSISSTRKLRSRPIGVQVGHVTALQLHARLHVCVVLECISNHCVRLTSRQSYNCSLLCICVRNICLLTVHAQGTIATWGTFAVLYFVALILNIICLFKVDGHRAPYGVLIPVQLLLAFACLANTTLTIVDNIDELPPWRVYAAMQAISSLFTNWGLALLFVALVLVVQERQDKYRMLTKRDSIVLGQRVMVTIAGSHLLFSVVFGLGTTTGVMATNAYNALSGSGERFQKRYDVYRNTLYASQAFYYITAGFLIYLALSLFKLMRSTHVADTVSFVPPFSLFSF